jgi:hypothetical protein
VLDRSFDPVAPLVHASGFEAMVHDRVALEYTDKLPGIVNARHTLRDGRCAYDIYVRDAFGSRRSHARYIRRTEHDDAATRCRDLIAGPSSQKVLRRSVRAVHTTCRNMGVYAGAFRLGQHTLILLGASSSSFVGSESIVYSANCSSPPTRVCAIDMPCY